MTSVAYQNELEQQFSRLPGFLQDVLRDPFNWVDGILKDIAGNPEQLASAGEAYAALGRQITQLGTQQAQDRQSILNGAWDGQAYQAFSAKMVQVEQQIDSLGRAAGQTQQLLDSAAQACTESADAIVSIVEGVISFALQSAIIAGVTSLITFGASAAADAALIVAKFADACEEIGGIVARLSTVLEKIANVLADLARIGARVAKYLKDLKDALKDAKWLSKEGFPIKAQGSAIAGAVRAATGEPLIGSPFPGIVGGLGHAAVDGYEGVKDAQHAKEQQ